MTIKTIRPEELAIAKRYGTLGVWWGNHCLATTDTREEAEQAKRAFEQVFAPRFTRDEAIAKVAALQATPDYPLDASSRECAIAKANLMRGIRLALEALDAARAFVDETDPIERKRVASATMSDLLDAAGIR